MNLVLSVEQQFKTTLQRADFLLPLATEYVTTTLNTKYSVTIPQALADEALASRLLKLLTREHAIREIAVLDPKTNEILAGSDTSRIRQIAPQYSDFRRLVTKAGWLTKAGASRTAESYQLEKPLQTSSGQTILESGHL